MKKIKTKELSALNKKRLSERRDTGLVDKKGNKIFEGDFLKFPAGRWKRDGSQRPYVVWTEEGWYISWSCRYTYGKPTNIGCMVNVYQAEWQVMGNVFENPELLKKNKIKNTKNEVTR